MSMAEIVPHNAQPSAKPVYPGAELAYSASAKRGTSLALPYLVTIPGGMKEGKITVVKLAVSSNPKRFHVNFQCGMSANPRSGVAMHFNPRFTENKIVLNSMYNAAWSWWEERPKVFFPFVPKGAYKIMFLCEREKFKVAINGLHLIEFKHRLPFQDITCLQIDGDCVLTEVEFF